jgi:FtsH-binding integral membrane protein
MHYLHKFYRRILLSLFIALTPLVVFAQSPSTFRELAGLFIKIMKGVINIFFALLAVGLVYGVVLYFANADNERKRTEIRSYLLWGVIGIVVVFGLWGILAILSNSLGWGAVGIPIIRPPV